MVSTRQWKALWNRQIAVGILTALVALLKTQYSLAIHKAETPSKSLQAVPNQDVGYTTKGKHPEGNLRCRDDVETLSFWGMSECSKSFRRAGRTTDLLLQEV